MDRGGDGEDSDVDGEESDGEERSGDESEFKPHDEEVTSAGNDKEEEKSPFETWRRDFDAKFSGALKCENVRALEENFSAALTALQDILKNLGFEESEISLPRIPRLPRVRGVGRIQSAHSDTPLRSRANSLALALTCAEGASHLRNTFAFARARA